MTTSTVARRWDGRSWTVRVATAALTPILTPLVIEDPSVIMRVAWMAALLWVPMISLTERLRLRWPGPIPVATSAGVDLLAAAMLSLAAPAVTPIALIAILPSALVHVLDLPLWGRWGLAFGVLALQVGLRSNLGGRLEAEIIAADLATALGAVLLLGHVERNRKQSRVALDQMGDLTDAVLAGIGEAVVVTDRGGVITSANAASQATFGRPVGGPCSDALGLARGAADLDCSKGCPLLGADGTASQVDVDRMHPSGRRQSLLVNVRALRDPLGRVRDVVHSFRDVSTLKQADQAKTLFLATASHELKTPLAVIGGFAELLAEERITDDETRRKALRTIADRSQQLTAIVERLLLASRIDGGGVRIVASPLELATVVADRVAALAALHPHAIVWQADPLPPVRAEQVALATVVDHLVENAVKYSPGGGDVVISAAADTRHVWVDVADHGIGMSPSHAEHCFEPFWQAEGTDSRRFGGSGIGLYIVDSLVRAMGGTVEVIRAFPGEGTTIRFTLERADIDDSPDVDDDPAGATASQDLMRQAGVGG